MKTEFYKYHGTGNDFVIIDNRQDHFRLQQDQIALLCHRHLGIGADGLMLLGISENCNFRMRYYNSDGKEGSMCGNGGRCITALARKLGLINTEATIEAIDGEHRSMIISDKGAETMVRIRMHDVTYIEQEDGNFFLDTGSPHYIKFVQEIQTYNVYDEGKRIRYSDKFREHGTNVDFVESINDRLFVRSYERGVENETLSCGTGVTASAVVWSLLHPGQNQVVIDTLGGTLQVSIKKKDDVYTDIWLQGPATLVYKGIIEIKS